MFVRKKAAPASKQAGLTNYRPPLMPLPINAHCGLTFQPHFGFVLNSFLKHRLDGGWKPAEPLGDTKSANSNGLINASTAVSRYWVSEEHAQKLNCKFVSNEEKEAGAVELPLPLHYCDNEAEMKEACQPRIFYNAGSFVDPTPLVSPRVPTKQMPRCGQTGNFFVKEELVSNLLVAAQLFDLKSPFWVKPSHPELETGYLSLIPGAEALTFSLTALVFLTDQVPLPSAVQNLVAEKNFLRNSPAALEAKKEPGLLNNFTGLPSKNPWLWQNEKESSWYTLDQIRFLCNVPEDPVTLVPVLSKANSESAKKHLELLKEYDQWVVENFEKGVLLEVDQWDLHNASSLTQPGRLAYDRSAQMESEKDDKLFV